MGIEPFLIASTVRVVVGQRLVRRLCTDCRVSFAPDEAALKQVDKIFRINDAAQMKAIHELEKQALDGGIGKAASTKDLKTNSNELSTTDAKIVTLWKSSDEGCNACNHTGYKGRIGIYEALGSSEKVQHLIVSNSTSDEIQKQAIAEGMVTMQLDGFIKALRGQTSVEEILRVTAED
jgi:type IV pilus assembly protein PilB